MSAPGALHNSSERFNPPKCHPHTRVAVLERLMNWVDGIVDRDALIMWLYGAAGAGKSAIAQSLAEMCEEKQYLLASFFFSRTAHTCNTAGPLIATIAYQVAIAIPAAKELIAHVVENNPMIFDQSIETQLSELILNPLQYLSSTGALPVNMPLVVIIDGLDECANRDVQCHIIRAVAAGLLKYPFRLRFLIASRPEANIRITFNTRVVQNITCQLGLSDTLSPDEDILLFLKDSFMNIIQEHPLGPSLPNNWPSEAALHHLVQKSSSQYIYASTVIRYIRSIDHWPTERLDVILGIQLPEGDSNMPFTELNALYMHLFSKVENLNKVMEVLGILLIFNNFVKKPLVCDHHIDRFLLWPEGATRLCLSQLASLIECQPTGYIAVKHASLADFLLDPFRSQQYHIRSDAVMANYTLLCLHHIQHSQLDKSRMLVRAVMALPRCLEAGAMVLPKIIEGLKNISFVELYHSQPTNNLKPSHIWSSWSSLIKVLQTLVGHEIISILY